MQSQPAESKDIKSAEDKRSLGLAVVYKKQTQSAVIEIEATGMIKHRFADENDAKKFLAWAKEQKQLPMIGIASVKEETDNGKVSYVVRLSLKQLELILDYQRSDSEIKRLHEQLMDAIKKDDAKEITKLMTGVRKEEQVRLLEITNDIGSNLLHLAAFYAKKNVTTLLNLFSLDVRNQALLSKTKAGAPVFSMVANYQPGDAFRQLIEKTDAKIIEQGLLSKSDQGSTGLFPATCHQPEDIFRLLIEKVDAKAINEAISVENRLSTLTVAAYKQSGDVFLLLLKKIDEKTLAETLAFQNPRTFFTVLHTAAIYQPDYSFA